MVDIVSLSEQSVVIEGLSSETKPTTNTPITALFYETDTGNKFEYRGQPIGWVQV